MPLRADLLNPIPGPKFDDVNRHTYVDKIKEALRQDDDLERGAWQQELKVADYALALKLAQDALSTKRKDLEVVAWICEALLRREKFAGLRDGLLLFQSLIDTFWDDLYPPIEDEDLEFRATQLEKVSSKSFAHIVKSTPLNAAGHTFDQFIESRRVGSEADATTPDQKKARDKALKEGKVAKEVFDKSFASTPKAFYWQSEKDLDGCLEALTALDESCAGKFGKAAPSFTTLKEALEEVRHTVHALLQDKRKTEPDPVEPPPQEAVAEPVAGETQPKPPAAAPSAPSAGFIIPATISSEPADRRDAIAAAAGAAAFLRKREPGSPAPFLLMRGLRWGELRADPELSDPILLEAPPTELRQHIKKLAIEKKWKELLDASENAMALPCSRAWLDLQRFAVEACVGLGDAYNAIAIAIRSELKTLLRDVPRLREAALMDDTPTANAETRAWIDELMLEPASAVPDGKAAPGVASYDPRAAGWQKSFIDSNTLALEAMRSGQEQKAFELLWAEIDRQRCGRGRFLRKMQLAQICATAGKDAILQTLLDEIAALIDTHKLEEWEDRETVVNALSMIMKYSKNFADPREKQKLFERICRIDPVQALNVGT